MKIAIIGGGIGGLTTALHLRDRGHDVTLFERERVAGGKIQTEKHDGWQIERGPAGVLDNEPATMALYQRVGIAAEIVVSDDATRKRFLYRHGHLRQVPDSPPKLLFSSALSIAEKLRIAREPWIAKRDVADETIGDFARRRFGESIASGIVDPVVSGIFAGDYNRLSLKSAFPKLAQMESERGSLLRGLVAFERQRRRQGHPRTIARLTSLRDGMAALPRALTQSLGDSVKIGTAVKRIDRSSDGLRVQFADNSLVFDRIVLALPPNDAAPLCRPLDEKLAHAYAAIPSVSLCAVTLGYRKSEVAHALDGFGFLIPRSEGSRLLGAIWMTSIFPDAHLAPTDRVMIRCMLGGATDPAASALSDAELSALAHQELGEVLPLAAPPDFQHVVRWSNAIPQYTVGHAERVATIDERGRALGIYGAGAALRGVGVNDIIRDAGQLADRI